ncbi:MAG: nucleotide exchange factor GrpE [Patescibacteria group bacterium]
MTKKQDKKSNIKELQEKCDEYLHGWKRAMVDYENFKKQSEKEKEEFVKFANTNLVMSLIPVYNNLKLALEHSPDDDWAKGIDHIQKQFNQVLEHNGVDEVLPKIGGKFNPEEHEAVEQNLKHNQQNTENKISKIISCGYKLNNKVFIPAKVIVK